MKRNFHILVGLFSVVMLSCAIVTGFIYKNTRDVEEITGGTFDNLKDYRICIPPDITEVNTLDDDSLNLMVVFVDKKDKIVYLGYTHAVMNKDNYLSIPGDKKSYILLDSTSYDNR